MSTRAEKINAFLANLLPPLLPTMKHFITFLFVIAIGTAMLPGCSSPPNPDPSPPETTQRLYELQSIKIPAGSKHRKHKQYEGGHAPGLRLYVDKNGKEVGYIQSRNKAWETDFLPSKLIASK